MCIGIPMQIVSTNGLQAVCKAADGEHHIDISLVSQIGPGDWIMTFLGAAREQISAETARQSADAIEALHKAMAGDVNIDHLFADLVNREPELPEHLRQRVDESSKGQQ